MFCEHFLIPLEEVEFLRRWSPTVGSPLSSVGVKPTDNAYIEPFNARFRLECLNEHWFLNWEDAREKVDEWCRDYNQNRPHSSLGNIPPEEYAGLKGENEPAEIRTSEAIKNDLQNILLT